MIIGRLHKQVPQVQGVKELVAVAMAMAAVMAVAVAMAVALAMLNRCRANLHLRQPFILA
jgi:hypothetical protein